MPPPLAALLRTDLSAQLPEYMVPAAYVLLDAFPLTPNGKLDRKALPMPDDTAYALRLYEAPQTSAEQTIAKIWRTLLKIEHISRHDNFFELGGHSLLAVRLLSRLSEALGATLPLAMLFNRPHLSELAHAVEDHLATAGVQPFQPIPRIARNQPLPLSFAQQRLWFLDQLAGPNTAYHMRLVLHLAGTLDIVAWRRSLNALFVRHEILRSTFVTIGGEPYVEILPSDSGLPLLESDLRHCADIEIALERMYEEDQQTAFDLTRGPVIRANLIRVSEEAHVFSLTQHHIVSDAWSIDVLLRELAALYHAFTEGRPSSLTETAIQYVDFAHWQREQLRGEVLERQLSYWKEQLADSPSLLALPTDRPRPPQSSHVGARQSFSVPPTLLAPLQTLSRQSQSTLFMTLCAAFNVLLARYTNQSDICIGTPIANRNRADIEDMIGLFVNTLVLRTHVDLKSSFTELLSHVRKHTLEAYANQDAPFEQLVEILKPERQTSYTPLFQVMLVLQNTPTGLLSLPRLSLNLAETGSITSKFDLTLLLSEGNEGLQGYFEYSTQLFDPRTIERMAHHFGRLLQAIVAEPERAVGELVMLDDIERNELLHVFNDTGIENLPARSDARALHELFEAQAAMTPDNVAIVYGKDSLTYSELNARANRLARYLRRLGVGPDVLVGLCVERSMAMIIGLLSVLKAGGAYVPLDPTYPTDRLAYTLADSAPVAVLANGKDSLPSAVRDLLQASTTTLLDLRYGTAEWECEDPTNLDASSIGLQSHHLAYIIYTSGSTGRPKGVMIEHGNVIRLLASTDHWYGFGRNDVWTLFHSFAFDFSVWEIWGALAYGGKLIVVPQALTRSPEQFYELLCAQGVTVLNQTPTAFRQLISTQSKSGKPHQLRYVIFGGEALDLSALKPWYERPMNAATRLVNMYGITETTVHVTYLALKPADAYRVGVSPIGRQIPDLQLYVMDTYFEPSPIGVAGELYVGGPGVARGYLNRPELTAERFIIDPLADNPRARLYKTGDVVRRLPDGGLEYLGRNDEQVKIRGFRIELGEIAARIAEHPAVSDSLVLVRANTSDEKRLVAYVIPQAKESITAEDRVALAKLLRSDLSRLLPEYMVPGAFVLLETFPLTRNGKLDHKALPSLDDTAFARRNYESPQGEIETTLAQLWMELLGLEKVGRHDHFFELGAHSLLVVRFVSRAAEFDLRCTVGEVFQNPILKDLALQIAEVSHSAGYKALPIRRSGKHAPIFFLPTGMGDYSYAFELARDLDIDFPVYALPWESPKIRGAETIEAMAAHMITLMKAVQPKGPYQLVGYSSGGLLAYAMAQQLLSLDETISFIGLIDVTLPTSKRSDLQTVQQMLLSALDFKYGNAEESHLAELRQLYSDVPTADLIKEVQKRGLLPIEMNPQEEALAWEQRHRISKLLKTYQAPRLPVSIDLFFATEQIPLSEAQSRAYLGTEGVVKKPTNEWANVPTRGWDNVLPRSAIVLHRTPGNHLTMLMNRQNRATLGASISGRLRTPRVWHIPTHSMTPLMPLSALHSKGMPLVCIPGAGASITSFTEFAESLGESQPVYGLQPRGLNPGEQPHGSVEAAAEYNLRAIDQLVSASPIHLLGHSYGGQVAFEMARRLTQRGKHVTSLTIIDSEPPEAKLGSYRDISGKQIFREFVSAMQFTFEKAISLPESIIDADDDLKKLEYLYTSLRKLGLVPVRSNPEMLSGSYTSFCAARRSLYTPATGYPGKIWLVQLRDPSLDQISDQVRMARSSSAWRLFTHELKVWQGLGHHYNVLHSPQVKTLAEWWQLAALAHKNQTLRCYEPNQRD